MILKCQKCGHEHEADGVLASMGAEIERLTDEAMQVGSLRTRIAELEREVERLTDMAIEHGRDMCDMEERLHVAEQHESERNEALLAKQDWIETNACEMCKRMMERKP